jgi:type IX secretion system PorP/SprF family membrane protein
MGSGLKAQDTYYSQFFANKIDLNPAFAGSQYYHRIIMNYRNQWSALGKPYVTYSLSYDRYLNGIGGVAVQIVQDKQANGAQVTSSIKGVYSYLVKINNETAIRLAVGASLIKNQIDVSQLIFPDMIDPDSGTTGFHDNSHDPVVNVKTDVDLSFGVLAHSGKYHFGFSAQHLAKPSISFTEYSDIPYKFVAHFGAEFPITSNGLHPVHVNVSPLFLMQAQGDNIQMNYGLYANRNSIIGGCWFRQNFNLEYDSVSS